MHIPAADPLGASCGWSDAAPYHTGLKVASSAAHLFGRAQASSDALAVVGDEAALRDLKYHLDYQMALGINHFTVHGLSYSIDGPRKDEVPPSIFYQHTEWKHMGVLLDHVAKTCEALTGGEHVCELALLYPSTSLACQARPGIDWHRLPDEPLIHALVERLLSHQRDFDFIDEVTLQENVDEHGRLSTPEGYRIILLPYLRYIDARTGEALRRFARAGGRVIAIGRMPSALTADLSQPVRDLLADSCIKVHETLDEATLKALPGVVVEGEGARDVFVLRRRRNGQLLTFAFNRRRQGFEGSVDGQAASIPPCGGAWIPSENAGIGRRTEIVAELSGGWSVTFDANHVPLNFWHASVGDKPQGVTPSFSGPAFDLMQRQPDPLPQGDGPVRYNCRFMLTGEIPDARLVMEDSTIAGDWKLYVNNVQTEGWKRAMVFDCRNTEAAIGHALRGGSSSR
jgi:hypothetical protein